MNMIASEKFRRGGKYIAEHFQSKATLLTKAEIIEEEVKSHCNIVHHKIEEYYKRRNAREIVSTTDKSYYPFISRKYF